MQGVFTGLGTDVVTLAGAKLSSNNCCPNFGKTSQVFGGRKRIKTFSPLICSNLVQESPLSDSRIRSHEPLEPDNTSLIFSIVGPYSRRRERSSEYLRIQISLLEEVLDIRF